MSSSPHSLLEMEAETRQASENYYRAVFENTGALTLIVEEDIVSLLSKPVNLSF